MDKLDEYNIKQIQLAYPENQAILFLLRIIKEAKIDYDKNKAYIEELEEQIRNNRLNTTSIDMLGLNCELTKYEIDNISKIEARKEFLYFELSRNNKALERKLIENRTTKKDNDKLISNYILLKKNKELELERDTLIKYIIE